MAYVYNLFIRQDLITNLRVLINAANIFLPEVRKSSITTRNERNKTFFGQLPISETETYD